MVKSINCWLLWGQIWDALHVTQNLASLGFQVEVWMPGPWILNSHNGFPTPTSTHSNPIPFGAHRISPRRPSTVRKSTSRPSDKLQHASSQVGAGYRQGLLLVAGVLNLLYVGTVLQSFVTMMILGLQMLRFYFGTIICSLI